MPIGRIALSINRNRFPHQKSRIGAGVCSCRCLSKANRPTCSTIGVALSGCRNAKIWPTNSEWSPQGWRATTLAARSSRAHRPTAACRRRIRISGSCSRLAEPEKCPIRDLWPRGKNVDTEVAGLQQEGVHARLQADRDHAQRRLGAIPTYGIRGSCRATRRTCVVMTVTPVAWAMTRRKRSSVTAAPCGSSTLEVGAEPVISCSPSCSFIGLPTRNSE